MLIYNAMCAGGVTTPVERPVVLLGCVASMFVSCSQLVDSCTHTLFSFIMHNHVELH